MIPAISFIIAAYVIFRCIEAMLQTAPGGRNHALAGAAQAVLALCAVTVILITIYYAAQINKAGAPLPGLTMP